MKAIRPEIKKPDVWFAIQHAHAKAAVILAHPSQGGNEEAFRKAVRAYDTFIERWQYHANHGICERHDCRKPFVRPHRRAGRVQRFCTPRCANIVECRKRPRKLHLAKSA